MTRNENLKANRSTSRNRYLRRVAVLAAVIAPFAIYGIASASDYWFGPKKEIISCFEVPAGWAETLRIEQEQFEREAGLKILNNLKDRVGAKGRVRFAEVETFWEMRGRLPELVGEELAASFESKLDWLAEQQLENGSWGDLRTTSLVLLALFGSGESTYYGNHKDQIEVGIKWLRDQQNPATGRFGSEEQGSGVAVHAYAALALAEAHYYTKHPLWKRGVQHAIEYLEGAQEATGEWRADAAAPGFGDVALTASVALVLETANHSGIEFDLETPARVLSWLDRITDKETGVVDCTVARVSTSRASSEQRIQMASAALNCRIALGQLDVERYPELEVCGRQLRVLLQGEPELSGSVLHDSSYAMFKLAGEYREEWEAALRPQPAQTYEQAVDVDLAQVATTLLTTEVYFRAHSLVEIMAINEERLRWEEERKTGPRADVIW